MFYHLQFPHQVTFDPKHSLREKLNMLICLWQEHRKMRRHNEEYCQQEMRFKPATQGTRQYVYLRMSTKAYHQCLKGDL